MRYAYSDMRKRTKTKEYQALNLKSFKHLNFLNHASEQAMCPMWFKIYA